MDKKTDRIIIALAEEDKARNDALDTIRCGTSIEESLLKKGIEVETLYINKQDLEYPRQAEEKILALNPKCIFNLFEGFSGDARKEADFVRLLEKIGFPFTGNSSSAVELCLHKGLAKAVLKEENVLVPDGLLVREKEDLKADFLNFPLFLKPCFEDASVGIDEYSLAVNKQELRKNLERKLKDFPEGVIVEEFICGREYNAGFLGNYPYETLGVSVIDYRLHENLLPFLTYNSKWETKSAEFKAIVPSLNGNIDDDLRERIVEVSRKAGCALGCKNYFRVDLRQRGDDIFVLDVNPNPDINQDSGFMKQAYSRGYSYCQVIEKIIKLSADIFEEKQTC